MFIEMLEGFEDADTGDITLDEYIDTLSDEQIHYFGKFLHRMYFVDYRDSQEDTFNTIYDTFTIDHVYEMLENLLADDDEIVDEILYHLSNLFPPQGDDYYDSEYFQPYDDIDEILADFDPESKEEYLNQLQYALDGFNFLDYGMFAGHQDGDIEDDDIYECSNKSVLAESFGLLNEKIRRVVTMKRRRDHIAKWKRGKNRYVGDVTFRNGGKKPLRLWKMRAMRPRNVSKARMSGKVFRRKRYYRQNAYNLKKQRDFIKKEKKAGRWKGGVHHVGHPKGRF